MISKILVPHDGTEMSDKALERAVELAKAFNAQLILLNINTPVAATYILFFSLESSFSGLAKVFMQLELQK
jgi:nucleotide-binding universal stress UspA family protein